MINILTIDQVLEYCDAPQLLLASDKFGTQYICLLYSDVPVLSYTVIRISDERFSEFCNGSIDLREVFVNTEFANEYFNAIFSNGHLECNMESVKYISEDRLPDEGFFYDSQEELGVTVKIPTKDLSFFNRFIHSHGWAASLL